MYEKANVMGGLEIHPGVCQLSRDSLFADLEPPACPNRVLTSPKFDVSYIFVAVAAGCGVRVEQNSHNRTFVGIFPGTAEVGD